MDIVDKNQGVDLNKSFQNRTKISEILVNQERTERKFWFQKGVIEFSKVTCLIVGGIFHKRIILLWCLCLAGLFQLLEYFLNYRDYDNHKFYSKQIHLYG